MTNSNNYAKNKFSTSKKIRVRATIKQFTQSHFFCFFLTLFQTTNLNQTSTFSIRPLSAKSVTGIEDPVGIERILEEQNIVSSSTCLPDSALYSETTNDNNTSCYPDVKLFPVRGIDGKMCSSLADSCAMSIPCSDSISSVRIYDSKEQAVEFVDMTSIDDIAAIIGSAIADTTVPNQQEEKDGADSRDR